MTPSGCRSVPANGDRYFRAQLGMVQFLPLAPCVALASSVPSPGWGQSAVDDGLGHGDPGPLLATAPLSVTAPRPCFS